MDMMKRYIRIIMTFAVLLGVGLTASAQDDVFILKGVVLDANTREPLQAVQISSVDIAKTVVTGEDGCFEIKYYARGARIRIVKKGYQTLYKTLYGTDDLTVLLQSASKTNASEFFEGADKDIPMFDKTGTVGVTDVDNLTGAATVFSEALAGRITGLNTTRKSGMPGEGAVLSLRGLRSLVTTNRPTIVIDGIPVMTGDRSSDLINGYSYDILESVDINNIDKVTFLKGADALEYGSLGSNGVLLITTQRGTVSKTKVEFRSVDGVSFAAQSIPLLSGMDYRRYIAEVAASHFSSTEEVGTSFPFLAQSMSAADQVRYGFNTDWQKVIYRPAWETTNSLKVRGGDEVVQYLVTAGFKSETGVLKGTKKNKFNTTGNTAINFSDKLKAYAAVSFDYVEQDLMEQGMAYETNPMLAAYASNPLAGIYDVDENGGILKDYAVVNSIIGVSNPAAIVSDVTAKNKVYDFNIGIDLRYHFLKNLYADVRFGLFYKYLKDDCFVAGRSGAIAPMYNGLALNTVRSGSSEFLDYYLKGSVNYDYAKNGHNLDVTGAYQLMISSQSSSYGTGINTTTDRYKTLGNVSGIGRKTGGYGDKLNWMNAYVKAEYNYRHQLYASFTGTLDASSSYGAYTGRAFVFPAVKAGWNVAEMPFFAANDIFSKLMFRAQYSINPNSMFPGSYSRYYYTLSRLKDISGLVRAGVPQKDLRPEKVHNIDLGMDFSLFGDKLTLTGDIFFENTRDMIVASTTNSIYGFPTAYKNCGSMSGKGAEAGISGVIVDKMFQWRIGTNISAVSTRITSLGDDDMQVIDLGNGVTVVNMVGASPYCFYGQEALGVFSTSDEAKEANLKTMSGHSFGAGDIHFRDVNGDGIINDKDRTIIGRQIPKITGSFYSQMKILGFTLYANFTGSYGNSIYNGTRRYLESESGFSNQALSVNRRWITEGQETDMPKVNYGDPAGNNRFSSRWIEKGSYIKLRELTFSWETGRKLLFLTGLKVFVTGENLVTFTRYTGSDPEFAYSYDASVSGMDVAKVALPRTVKCGLVMNF